MTASHTRNNVRQDRHIDRPYVLVMWTDGLESRQVSLAIGAEEVMDDKYYLPFGSVNEAMEYGRKIAEQLIEKQMLRDQDDD